MKKLRKSVLKNFDFEKVQKVMEFLNWRWDSLGRVPDAEEIKKQAKKLLKECEKLYKKDKKSHTVSTGGLQANVFDDSGEVCMVLSFILEEFESII